MKQETRVCQNCKSEFVIESEDFAFYEKIKVPPPTWCPECRLVRRMLFLNERALYKNTCALCGKSFVSLLHPEAHKTVYCPQCWWSDKWNPIDYGREVDFSRSFLEQFRELQQEVPEMGRQTMETTLVNSEYVNICSYLKNCYLVFNSDYDEDCFYSTYLERSKNCLDIYMGDLCELCFESSNLFKGYHVLFSNNCNECVDVFFSKNLVGCSNCFGCVNLRNKHYYIFNTPYSKNEYLAKIGEYDIGSFKLVEEIKSRLEELSLKCPKKHAEGLKNVNVTGDYVFNSKNTLLSYEVGGCEDCKFCQFLFLSPTKDSYDFTMWGGRAERMYECMGAGGGQHDVKFTFETWTNAMYLEYSWNILARNSYLFGCVGLKNKQYCILNRQYSKEEYEKLVPKIIEHMNTMPYVDEKGRVYKYGEFFPPEFSLFGYNESVAQAYFPLTKDRALGRGYKWRDSERRNYGATIKSQNLPDHIKDVPDSIINEIVECGHRGECTDQCTTAFKIIPRELQFYRKMNLPLPRLCPNCRHYERLKQRNSLKLWHRACMCNGYSNKRQTYKNTVSHFHGAEPCPNEFETSYAPERPEIVYCEQCYNAEVG